MGGQVYAAKGKQKGRGRGRAHHGSAGRIVEGQKLVNARTPGSAQVVSARTRTCTQVVNHTPASERRRLSSTLNTAPQARRPPPPAPSPAAESLGCVGPPLWLTLPLSLLYSIASSSTPCLFLILCDIQFLYERNCPSIRPGRLGYRCLPS